MNTEKFTLSVRMVFLIVWLVSCFLAALLAPEGPAIGGILLLGTLIILVDCTWFAGRSR